LTVRRLNPAVDFNDRQEISRSVRHLQAVQRISTKFRIVLQKGGFIAEGCFWITGIWGWFSDGLGRVLRVFAHGRRNALASAAE